MKGVLLTFLLIAVVNMATAQKSITGRIYYLNSRKTPVAGVQVNAIGSNGSYSKSEGEFTLDFNLDKGAVTKISLGDSKTGKITDKENRQLELVNVEILEPVVIPENAYDAPVKIILCPKGSRDITAQKYYRIIKSSADVELAKAKEKLASLLKQQTKDSLMIRSLTDKINRITAGNDSLTIYSEAFAIASTNKDDAPERVLLYLKLLDEGKSVQEAREALNPQAALREGYQNIKAFEKIIENLEMRINASKAIADYEDATKWYDSTLLLIEQSGMSLKYNKLFGRAIEYAADYADFPKAHSLYTKRLMFLKAFKPDENPKLFTENYIQFGRLLRYMGRRDSALHYYRDAFALAVKHKDSASAGTLCNNLSLLHKDLGNLDSALYYAFKQNDYGHMDLTSSINIGYILQDRGNDSLAAWFFHFTVHWILERKAQTEYAYQLCNAYSGLGISLGELKKTDSAIYFHKLAIDIATKHKLLPLLSDHLSRYGSTLHRAKKYAEALAVYKEEVRLTLSLYEPTHPDVGGAYFNLGTIYSSLGKADSALKYKELALFNRKLNYEPTHPEYISAQEDYGFVCLVLINKYRAQKDNDNVLKTYDRWIKNDPQYRWVFLRGQQYYRFKNYKSARADFDVVIAAEPNTDVYRYRGLCNYFLDEYRPAINDYLQSRAIDTSKTGDSTYYNNIGCAYVKDRQFEKARVAFERYEQLQHDKGRALRNWAMYYALTGDKEKALFYLTEAVKNGFTDSNWLQTDSSMNSLRNEPRYRELLGAH